MSNIDPYQKRYSCSKCKTGFGRKPDLNRHLMRKTSCTNDITTTATIITTLYTSCPYCCKTIKTMTEIDFMTKHLEQCTFKQQPIINNIVEQQTVINNTTDQQPIINNIVEQQTVINNIFVNIQINTFYAPSIDHLVYDAKLFSNRPKILKETNFNPLYPTNHNMFKDPGSGEYYIYENGWKTVTRNQLQNKISVLVDKVQERVLDREFANDAVRQAELNNISKKYGEKEKLNYDKFISIVDSNSDIPIQTKKRLELQEKN